MAVLAAEAPPPGGAPPQAGGSGPADPSPAQIAVEYRQSLYNVLGHNFMPIGAMLQGHTPFNGTQAAKHADRVAYIATMLGDAFPEISKDGKTEAKPEIWTHRAEFDKKLEGFVADTAALARLLRTDKTNAVAFKKAAGAVGQDCKGCHDKFKSE